MGRQFLWHPEAFSDKLLSVQRHLAASHKGCYLTNKKGAGTGVLLHLTPLSEPAEVVSPVGDAGISA